jgi:hypothetical protein
MSDNQIIAIGLASTMGIGILILLLIDRFYIERTGKPASERVREKNERMNGPISRAQYLGRSVVYVLIFLVFMFGLLWTNDFKGRNQLFPFLWVFLSAFWFCQLQVRWRNQQRKGPNGPITNQLSGTPK